MMDRRFLLSFPLFLAMFLLAACGVPGSATPTPTPTPAPTPITTPFAGIREDPQRLTLIQTDLPEGFRKLDNVSLHAGHNAVLFMNPEAVEASSHQRVLGVVDEITTYELDVDARDAFENDLLITEQDIAHDIAGNEGVDAESIRVTRYAPELEGADLLRAFRVFYRVGEKSIYEYRYQFMVSNAIGNVIVTVGAQADGGESDAGRAQADAIAQAQLDKLNSFRATP